MSNENKIALIKLNKLEQLGRDGRREEERGGGTEGERKEYEWRKRTEWREFLKFKIKHIWWSTFFKNE